MSDVLAVLAGADGTVNVVSIASQLNAKIDIPWIPESMEQKWIEWVLGKILKVIPLELAQLLVDSTDGISEEEISRYEQTIVDLVNDLVDLPVLTESWEEKLIRPVVHQLLLYAATGKALSIE